MLADDGTVGLSLSRRADAGRAGHVVPGAAGRGRVHRLDRLAPARTSTTTRTSPSAWTCTRRGPGLDDLALRENQVIRIYDIVFDYENLLGTDRFYRKLCRGEAFQQTMGTAEFHYLVGKYLAEREDADRPAAARACWPPRYRLRRADLHRLARRQLDRHEPGRAAARRLASCASTRCAT